MRGLIIVILLLAATVFILQNTELVTVQFMTHTYMVPRALLLAITVCVGIIIGMLIPTGRKVPKQSR